jgi:hypothetical protein
VAWLYAANSQRRSSLTGCTAGHQLTATNLLLLFPRLTTRPANDRSSYRFLRVWHDVTTWIAVSGACLPSSKQAALRAYRSTSFDNGAACATDKHDERMIASSQRHCGVIGLQVTTVWQAAVTPLQELAHLPA